MRPSAWSTRQAGRSLGPTALASTTARRLPATAVWLLAVGAGAFLVFWIQPLAGEAPAARPRRSGRGVGHRPRLLPGRAARGLRPGPPPRASAPAAAPARRPRPRVGRRPSHPPARPHAAVRGDAGRCGSGGVAPRHPRGRDRPRLPRGRPRHPPRLLVARALGPSRPGGPVLSLLGLEPRLPGGPPRLPPRAGAGALRPRPAPRRGPARSRPSPSPWWCSASARVPGTPAFPRGLYSRPRRGVAGCWRSPRFPPRSWSRSARTSRPTWPPIHSSGSRRSPSTSRPSPSLSPGCRSCPTASRADASFPPSAARWPFSSRPPGGRRAPGRSPCTSSPCS